LHFRFGLFQSICKAYELVLSDGSVVWCDKDNNCELYSAIPFSYGTLGFLTAVDIDIIPYKPYLKHTYHPTYTLEDAVKLLETLSNDPDVDTVEGIVFSENKSVIMSGKFVDDIQVKKYFKFPIIKLNLLYYAKRCNISIN
jgi:delta24-sterol reductase